MKQDNSFPYVLLISTFGVILSLGAVWISYAPAALGA
jgi:hypothetical protein